MYTSAEIIEVERYITNIDSRAEKAKKHGGKLEIWLSRLGNAYLLDPKPDPFAFFAKRPHLLMMDDFDEFRDLGGIEEARERQQKALLAHDLESSLYMAEPPPGKRLLCFRQVTGKWWGLNRVPWTLDGHFEFIPLAKPGWFDKFGILDYIEVPFADLLQVWHARAGHWIDGERCI